MHLAARQDAADVTGLARRATMQVMRVRKLDDAQLLHRIAGGDERAFSELYARHLDGVVAFFRRRVPTPDLAFDLAAETFAVVVTSAGSYAGDGPPAGWLYGIARNKLRESLRRGQVEASARARLALEPVVLSDEALERVEERAGRGDRVLADSLAELSDAVRGALLARVVDEEPYEDIAARLGCSEQVVRKRVQRGLAALRTGMEEGR
jgi:RNA polymerase sigma-70 factor (ECF subfamily)